MYKTSAVFFLLITYLFQTVAADEKQIPLGDNSFKLRGLPLVLYIPTRGFGYGGVCRYIKNHPGKKPEGYIASYINIDEFMRRGYLEGSRYLNPDMLFYSEFSYNDTQDTYWPDKDLDAVDYFRESVATLTGFYFFDGTIVKGAFLGYERNSIHDNEIPFSSDIDLSEHNYIIGKLYYKKNWNKNGKLFNWINSSVISYFDIDQATYGFSEIKIADNQVFFFDETLLYFTAVLNLVDTKDLPYYHMPSLGGKEGIVGINNDKTSGPVNLYTNIIYRRKIYKNLSGNLYAGVGIFSNDYETISAPSYAYGAGLSFKLMKDRGISLYTGLNEDSEFGIGVKMEFLFE